MKCILLGAGGREAIMAMELSKKFKLYSIMPYENPSIKQAVLKSGGKYLIHSPFDKHVVSQFIDQEKIELFVVNNDDLLEAGLIDLAKSKGLKTFGPTRLGAKIEWSKKYAIELIEKIAPEIAIKTYIVKNLKDIKNFCESFEDLNFVVKPDGLTAGKGVKVGGEHFSSVQEGIKIATEYLMRDGSVIIQEKIVGYEFTIMGFTDGKNVVLAPATYDYPYRYDGDEGPGTGGMGCFSCANGMLPFINSTDIEKCKNVMQKVLYEINKIEKNFNGVLNGGFFKTTDGKLKFMEFNARLGDPEALNVLTVLKTSFGDVVYDIAVNENINSSNCIFEETNSYVVYIVTNNYAINQNVSNFEYEFTTKDINADVNVYFGNVEEIESNRYRVMGNSRLMAFVTKNRDMKKAKISVDESIEKCILDKKLDYRKDIANIAINNDICEV